MRKWALFVCILFFASVTQTAFSGCIGDEKVFTLRVVPSPETWKKMSSEEILNIPPVLEIRLKGEEVKTKILDEKFKDVISSRKWVVVYAPHPDDEVIGVGGWMSEKSKDCNVCVVMLTRGDRSGVYDAYQMNKTMDRAGFGVSRMREFVAAASEVKVGYYVDCDFGDGKVIVDKAFLVMQAIDKVLNVEIHAAAAWEAKYPHPDHRNTGTALSMLKTDSQKMWYKTGETHGELTYALSDEAFACKQRAYDQYKYVNESDGRYGIAYKSLTLHDMGFQSKYGQYVASWTPCYNSRTEWWNTYFGLDPLLNRNVTVAAVQYKLALQDYSTNQSFENAMEMYVSGIRNSAPRDSPCLIVFPKNIGLYLLFSGEQGTIPLSQPFASAMISLIGKYITNITSGEPTGNPVRTVLLLKADAIMKTYLNTFSYLAKKYDAYIVGGTVCVPDCNMTDGAYVPVDEKVYNKCYIFSPNGNVTGVQKKIHLTDFETSYLGLSPGDVSGIQSFDTAVGRISAAIGIDLSFDDVKNRLASLGPEVVAHPAYDDNAWTMEEQEFWKGTSWNYVQNNADARYAILSFLVSADATLPASGQSAIIADADLTSVPLSYGELDPSLGYLAVARSSNEGETLNSKMCILNATDELPPFLAGSGVDGSTGNKKIWAKVTDPGPGSCIDAHSIKFEVAGTPMPNYVSRLTQEEKSSAYIECDAREVPQGQHKIVISVSDNSGNKAVLSFLVTLD